jgi:hypothetical protein
MAFLQNVICTVCVIMDGATLNAALKSSGN